MNTDRKISMENADRIDQEKGAVQMIRKWKNAVRKLSRSVTIENKLRWILLVASMIPILCIGIFSALHSYKMMREEALDYSQRVARSAAGYIEQHFLEYIRQIETLEENDKLMDRLSSYTEQDWDERRQTENELRLVMNSIFGSNHEVDTIEYVNADGIKFYYYLPITARESVLLKKTAASEGILWSHGVKESGEDDNEYIIISKQFSNKSIILLSLKKDYIEQLCSAYTENSEWLTSILDNNEEAIINADQYEAASEEAGWLDTLRQDALLVTTYPISFSGWEAAQGIPYSYLYRGAQIQLFFMMVLMAGLLLVVFFLVRIMMGSILEPLTKLTKAVKKGNMEYIITDYGADEYHEIIVGFNEMSGRINRMITEVLDMELKESRLDRLKKETELSALQKQINPHFLYNTLETIYWNGQYEGAEEISEMVIAMGNYFRNIINKGKESTTVRNEAASVDNYLYLQNIRFQDSISVIWALEKDIQELRILKLVLQPIIEDMINKILDFRRDRIQIFIAGNYRFGYVIFSIQLECNGIKIEMKVLDDQPGWKNVDQRLKLYFGSESGIVMEHEILHIFVPAAEEGGEADE